MGFLDMFDDPNILSALLGGGARAASRIAQTSMPTPPAQPSPESAGPAPMLPAAASSAAAPAAPPQVSVPQVQVQPAPAAPAPPMPAVAPEERSGVSLPPNSAPTAGGPLSTSPPPMPPPSAFSPALAPPTSTTGGGLRSALGLDQSSWVRPAMAGLGHGLSAVGQMRPGTPGAAAFAAGAGGALQGTEAARNTQDQMARQAKNDLFTQSSTAFKDMLAAKNSDNTEGYRQAQAQYLRARAQSLLAGGGANGSRSMLNTLDGKVAYVEGQALKYRDQLRKSAEAKAKAMGQPIDDAAVEKDTEAYRKRLYDQFKIDPKDAEKAKSRGLSKDNPFDTKGMTLDQFHEQVPMGAWYKDQNGVPRQRTVAPPNASGASWSEPPSSAAPAASPTATNDDYVAMTPTA